VAASVTGQDDTLIDHDRDGRLFRRTEAQAPRTMQRGQTAQL